MTTDMTDDIAKRLRCYREEFDNGTFCWSEPIPWMVEAADEIDALRAAIHSLVRSGKADISSPPWMLGSPADKVVQRALRNNDSTEVHDD